MVLHDLALKDEYFIKRNLYPNVDFWRYVAHVIYPIYPLSDLSRSGLIYKAMGVSRSTKSE